MRQSTAAHDLRSLLALACQLRALSDQPMADADRTLYRAAAAALEARAKRLATSLPAARYDWDGPDGHRPVDLLI